MTWEVAAATGHRKLTKVQHRWVTPELARVADKLRTGHGCTTAVSGMALLVDQEWADVALDAGLDLWAVVPFPAQPDTWPEADRDRWHELLKRAHRVSVVSEEDPVDNRQAAKMLLRRNDKMLVVCDVVVAVWDPSRTQGGTYSAVDKAVRRGLPVIWLNPAAETVKVPTAEQWRRHLPFRP
jgi:DNA recombination-mediator protein A